MRYFVLYKKERYSVDVNKGDSVREIKDLLRKKFDLDAVENYEESRDVTLLLSYAGSNLENEWVLSDIALQTGSTLRCVVQQKIKPYLRVYCTYSSETITFTEPFDVFETKVSDLRTMITDKTGLHVSVFRLVTMNGCEMYDCHLLKDYKIDIGGMVRMETWNGWGDFLKAASKGQITPTMKNVVSFNEDPLLAKYQLLVALFIAAHFNFTQLTAQLLKSGARCDEAVGEHPVREWCKANAHPDHYKSPVHQAAQRGSLACLRQFIHHNFACILAKDAEGLTPCNLACRYKQRECFKLLITEQFRKRNINGLTLNIYLKVRKWSERARDRASIRQKHSQNHVLLAMENRNCKKAVIGQVVQVDGFGKNMQESGAIIDASMKLPKAIMTRHRALTGASSIDINFSANSKINGKSVRATKWQTNVFNHHENSEIRRSEKKQQSVKNHKSSSSQAIETLSRKQKVFVNANDLRPAVTKSRCQVKRHDSENEKETGSSSKDTIFQKERKVYRWKDSIGSENELMTKLKNKQNEISLRNNAEQNEKMPEITTSQNLTAVKENKSVSTEDSSDIKTTCNVFVTEMFGNEDRKNETESSTGNLPSLEKEFSSFPTPPLSCKTCGECFSNLLFPSKMRQKTRGRVSQKSRSASCDSENNINYRLGNQLKKGHTITGSSHVFRSRSACDEVSLQSMEIYRGVTGMTIPESARASMDLAMTFNKKSWLNQIRMAIDFNSNSFKRQLSDERNITRNRSLSEGAKMDHRSSFHSV